MYATGVMVCPSTCGVPHLEIYDGQFLSLLCMLTSVTWAGNHQGLPNSIRQKDNLENGRGKKDPLSKLITDILQISFFHNLVGYGLLGFGSVVNMHCKSTTKEMCLLERFQPIELFSWSFLSVSIFSDSFQRNFFGFQRVIFLRELS